MNNSRQDEYTDMVLHIHHDLTKRLQEKIKEAIINSADNTAYVVAKKYADMYMTIMLEAINKNIREQIHSP